MQDKIESESVEFKSKFNDEVMETLTALANTKSGKVLVGVTNSGTPVKGFNIGNESIRHLLPMQYSWDSHPAHKIKKMSTQRTEIFEYPVSALGEIALNSIVHHDCLSPVDIQIRVYDKKYTDQHIKIKRKRIDRACWSWQRRLLESRCMIN